MQTSLRRRHRHTVALPLFMMFVVAFLTLESAMFSRVQSSDSLAYAAVLPSDAILRASTGATVYTGISGVVTLAQGEAIFRAHELRTAQLSCGTLMMLSSAVYAQSVDRETCTISPLDGVALFHGSGSDYFAILSHTQLLLQPGKRPALAPVSSTWVQEQHRNLGTALNGDQSFVMTRHTSLRSDEARFIDAYMQVRDPSSDEDDRAAAVDILLHQSVYSPSYLPFFPLLVRQGIRSPSEGEIRTWTQAVLVQGMQDRSIAEHAIESAHDAIAFYDETGFPRSSQNWAISVDTLSRVFPPLPSTPLQQEEQSSVDAPSSQWTMDSLQKAAEQMLYRAGFLVPMTAVIEPDTSSSTVKIDGVFFAESGQDVPYAFTYVPERDLLQYISRDGKSWPNVFSVTQFLSLSHE